MSKILEFTLIISFLVFLGAISAGIYVPALPELGKVFHVPSLHIKLSITLYFVGAMGGSIIAGPLSMRYGRESFIFIFLLIFIFASLICAFSDEIGTFFVGRFFQGAGIIGTPIISLAATADRYKGNLYRHMTSLIIVLIAIGTGISHFIGVAILRIFEHWQAIFYFLAAAGGCALYLCYYTNIGGDKVTEKVENPDAVHRIVNRHSVFKYYQIMIGSLEGTLYAFIVVSPYIFRMEYGWSMFEFSLIGLILAGGSSLASLIDVKIYPLLGSKTLTLVGLGLLGVACLPLLFFGDELPALGLVSVMIFFVMGSHFIGANLILKAMRIEPRFTTISSSLIIFSKIVACALALVLVLFFPEKTGTVTFFVVLAAIICGLGYLKVRKSFSSKS